jgi:hypothetical protein
MATKERNTKYPPPEVVKAARERVGLSQRECGEIIESGLRGWQNFEYGVRKMHPGLLRLFLIETGQIKSRSEGGGSKE